MTWITGAVAFGSACIAAMRHIGTPFSRAIST